MIFAIMIVVFIGGVLTGREWMKIKTDREILVLKNDGQYWKDIVINRRAGEKKNEAERRTDT